MYEKLRITILLLTLSGCAIWPLGEDPTGKEYRAQAELLVMAIINYKEMNGALPPSLDALTPKYIQELPEIKNNIFYSHEEESLNYDYTPSWPQAGRTSCYTVIGSGKWDCHGYI